mmetsp:Transcript_53205/g.158566  ORF Transcript_53205/g.158566 Transcript_53205/m.158566 type:complete len:302 (-) Transcript_53205:12-917(-)
MLCAGCPFDTASPCRVPHPRRTPNSLRRIPALVADEIVCAENPHALELGILDGVGHCTSNLLDPHRWAENALQQAWHHALERHAGPRQGLEDQPHRLQHEPKGHGHAATVARAGDGAGLHNQHSALAACLRVLQRLPLGRFLALPVAGNHLPAWHGCVDQDHAGYLVLRSSPQHANIRQPIGAHGTLLVQDPWGLTNGYDDGVGAREQGCKRLRPQCVYAVADLHAAALCQPAAGTWAAGAAKTQHWADATACELPADGGAHQAAPAKNQSPARCRSHWCPRGPSRREWRGTASVLNLTET